MQRDASQASSTTRSGWILNLGSRVVCTEWAPELGGDYQYLAVSVDKGVPPNIPKVSALDPTAPFESSIQIWAFKTVAESGSILMDMDAPPRLVHVVCHCWGTTRRLGWCPFPVKHDSTSSSIGLLALITTDGYIRVVDVCVENDIGNPYVKYEAAAFASKPPDTVCTCLTWLSNDRIAVGCGNGHVAIWNIADCIAKYNKDTPDVRPAPFWYHRLHTTFVVSIISYQPYPTQYLATNAVDGKERVTSIQNPYHDTVWGSRERYLIPSLTYSPHIMGLYETDETDGVRARPLRHHPQSRAVGKAPAQILCMDSGKVHPSILFGCADGSVSTTNPTRRIFIRRLTAERVEAWQQTWFRHEFVPENRQQTKSYEVSLANDLANTSRSYTQPRKGVSRFLESYKLGKVPLVRNQQLAKGKDKKPVPVPVPSDDDEEYEEEEEEGDDAKTKKGKQKVEYEEIQISIFEEEQAVTCVAWNPNLNTGGWAAATMANGLIRVEDLAV